MPYPHKFWTDGLLSATHPSYIRRAEKIQEVVDGMRDIRAVVIRGGPGAGKATLAKAAIDEYLGNETEHTVIEIPPPFVLKERSVCSAMARALNNAVSDTSTKIGDPKQVETPLDFLEYCHAVALSRPNGRFVLLFPSFHDVVRHDEFNGATHTLTKTTEVLDSLVPLQSQYSRPWISRFIAILIGRFPSWFYPALDRKKEKEISPFRARRVKIGVFHEDQICELMQKACPKLWSTFAAPEEAAQVVLNATNGIPALVQSFGREMAEADTIPQIRDRDRLRDWVDDRNWTETAPDFITHLRTYAGDWFPDDDPIRISGGRLEIRSPKDAHDDVRRRCQDMYEFGLLQPHDPDAYVPSGDIIEMEMIRVFAWRKDGGMKGSVDQVKSSISTPELSISRTLPETPGRSQADKSLRDAVIDTLHSSATPMSEPSLAFSTRRGAGSVARVVSALLREGIIEEAKNRREEGLNFSCRYYQLVSQPPGQET